PGALVRKYAELFGWNTERGVRALAGSEIVLDERLIWLLTDALNVESKKQIPHGGVAGDDDLIDLPAAERKPLAERHDLAVHGVDHGSLQLASRFARIIGDATHDIAAAETLRILEGATHPRLTG